MSVFSYCEMCRHGRDMALRPDRGYRCRKCFKSAISAHIMIGGDYAGEVRSVDQLGGI